MAEHVRKMVSLPIWAVSAIAKSDVHTLLDRCEHETILVEVGDHPTVVLLGYEEWLRLVDERNIGRMESLDDEE
jgi:hypothetical protein